MSLPTQPHSLSSDRDPDSSPSPINLDQLQQSSGGDPTFERMILEAFLEDTATQLQEIEQALQDQDANQLRYLAHRLKGSSGNVGADQIQVNMLMLETKAAQGDLEGGESLLKSTQIQLAAIETFLAQLPEEA